jgi:proteasome lid subunit RPN8/RPN11
MIVVPAWAWTTVVEAFTGAGGMVERVAFLDGIPGGPASVDGGVVTSVTFPHADESEGHWDVDAREMSRAGAHLRSYGLVRLAQVHTHPGCRTDHSDEDEQLAFSQEIGAVSIVLPSFGLTCPGLGDAGVHRREPHGWQRVEHDDLPHFVRIVPSVLDLRYA